METCARALQKIYLLLERQDETQIGVLCQRLGQLFDYANLTSNLVLVLDDLTTDLPKVQAILETAGTFLKETRFARLYVHFVHPASNAGLDALKRCYRQLKQQCRYFDQEGFIHQELPRLMLLPLLIPDEGADPAALAECLDELKASFLMPGLCLEETRAGLAQGEILRGKAEKIYYGRRDNSGVLGAVSMMCQNDIIEDSCVRLGARPVAMDAPCPAALILWPRKAEVFGCFRAFCERNAIGPFLDAAAINLAMDRCNQASPPSLKCSECREEVASYFASLPLPKANAEELGAVLFHFGTLREEEGDHLRAVALYQRSLALSPQEHAGLLHFRSGLSLAQTGRHDLAIEAFASAEPFLGHEPYLHFYIATCYFEQGDYEAAIEGFSRALDKTPPKEDLVRILIYLGTCYNCTGRYHQAIPHLERAKATSNAVKEVYSALGLSYFQIKAYDQAIANLHRAVDLDPTSAIDYASLGANYRDKGDKERAIAMYERALALDPGLISARQNLERLKDQG